MKTIIFLIAILLVASLNGSRAQNTWLQKADFGGTERWGAVGFSIENKGYIGTGSVYPTFYSDFWEYDPITDSWTQKADFGGGERYLAVGFSIYNKGYVGTGLATIGGSFKKDFWEYDPTSNVWIQKMDFAGTARNAAVGFSIGNKGYIGTGYDGSNKDDFWEYDPATNGWKHKANFGGTARYFATGFSIGNKGYVGTGYDGSNKDDFWEYDPATNGWTQKANFGGTARWDAIGFSIGSQGYIGIGVDAQGLKNNFWEYQPGNDSWIQKANFGGSVRQGAVGFSTGSKGYIGTGYDFACCYLNDFWEYTPDSLSCSVPTNLSVTNITSSSAKLNWDAVAGAEGYKVRYKVSGTSEWTKKDTYNSSKSISGLFPNTAYKWEVRTYCQLTHPHVKSDWTSMQEFATGSFRLGVESAERISFHIYPNPAETDVHIQFTLPQASHVSIKLYDVSGKEIACPDLVGETLLDAELQQGEHSVLLNTSQFSKGVYFVKMISDFGIENQKLIVQ